MVQLAEEGGHLRSLKTWHFSLLTVGRRTVLHITPSSLQQQWDSRGVTGPCQQESKRHTHMARAQGRAHTAMQEADTEAVDPRAENDGMQQCYGLSRGENYYHNSRWRVRQTPFWSPQKKERKKIKVGPKP